MVRYAATDENGRFHFEGIEPGTHVVQVDKESIPDNLEIVECVKNTRYAGTPYSQFVDIQGGTLWRTDFYVREKKPITDTATLFIKSELNEEDIKYTIEMSNGEIPVKNYRLIVNLPDGIEFDRTVLFLMVSLSRTHMLMKMSWSTVLATSAITGTRNYNSVDESRKGRTVILLRPHSP
jgi:hypothetical protein